METIWIAIFALSLLSLIFGLILGYASRRFQVEADPIVDKIDDILPQSQCGQCGYPGCRPYAEAISKQKDTINRCAPGGETVMLKIADLLNIATDISENETLAQNPVQMLAVIDEANCIGCTKCIHACPVDAIIGTGRMMHTVLSDYCTGCNLCITPCPTGCISLRPVALTAKNWKWNTIPVQVTSMEHHV